ncbi:hypothetical protein NEOC95_002259 [Neochlamydia sp. AcF95]|nr:hypothetical protein [Neochlamydia sp. AcF95]
MHFQRLKEGKFLLFLIKHCAGFKGNRQGEVGLEGRTSSSFTYK